MACYALFLIGLILTAFGSAYYHWLPDNARLVWDRLPIALVCAGLLAAVWAQMALPPGRAGIVTGLLALYAVLSVLWWYWTELNRRGDLRPYLLLQILPILPRDPLSSVALNHLHGLRSGKREPIFFPPRAPAQVP